MGIDLFEVKDFIEEKGIPEYSHEIIIDYLRDRNYQNPLKVNKPQVQSENIASYEYYDPVS